MNALNKPKLPKILLAIALVAIGLISVGHEDVFGFTEVGLMDDYIQIAKVSERQIAINRMRQDRTLEGRDWNLIFAKFSEQSKKLRVIAQRPGTVLSAPLAAGDRVTSGAVLFQIGDLSELSVEVPVGGRIARQIHKGDKVLVRLPMDPPRQVEASVSTVLLAPGQDPHSYVVRVVIANPDSSVILAGLEGEVVFRHSGSE